MPIQPIISSNVYVDFRSLPQNGWMEVIRLYENRREEVEWLSSYRHLDILHKYVEALYHVKDYYKLIKEVDQLIAMSLSEDVPYEVGKEYYKDALFWKGLSHGEMMDYKEANTVMKALVKIQPNKEEYRKAYANSLYRDKPNILYRAKALAVFCFLLSAVIILAELLVIQHFFSSALGVVVILRNTLFVAGFLLVGLSELIHWSKSELKAKG